MLPDNLCVATSVELTRRRPSGRGAPVNRGNVRTVLRDRVLSAHLNRMAYPPLLTHRTNMIVSSRRLMALPILDPSRCISPITLAWRRWIISVGWRRTLPAGLRGRIPEPVKKFPFFPGRRPPLRHGRSLAKGMASGCKYVNNVHKTGPSAVAHGLPALAGQPPASIASTKGATPVDVAVVARVLQWPPQFSRTPSRTN